MFPTKEEIASIPGRTFIYSGEVVVATSGNGGAGFLQIPIQSDADFWSVFMTMTYPTVNGGVDDGVCRLSVQLRDQNQQQGLFSGFVNLALLAVPGRQRTAGINGDPSLALNVTGYPFPYLWERTGAIELDFRNEADTAATVRVAFFGAKYFR